MGRPGGYRWLKAAAKSAVGVLVLWAVARHVGRTWADIQERGGPPRVEASWVALAVALYLAGLGLFGMYFVRVLDAGPAAVPPFAGWRAYLISHLAKYVPGKALVVVTRVGLVTPYGARASTAAFATLYETLVMMAAGGLIAAATLPRAASVAAPAWVGLPGYAIPLGWVGLGLGAAFLAIVGPSVFPRLAGLATRTFRDLGPDALPRMSSRLLLEGLAIACGGWILLGLSQVAVIRALDPSGLPVASWPAAVGSVALATVAGFAVPVSPGGLGVREWVLWTALGAVLDQDLAVLASLGLRLAWVGGEVLAAGALLVIRPSPAIRPVEAASS